MPSTYQAGTHSTASSVSSLTGAISLSAWGGGVVDASDKAVILVFVSWPGGSGIVEGTVTDSKGRTYTLLGAKQENTTPLTWGALYMATVGAEEIDPGDTITYTHSAAAGTRSTGMAFVVSMDVNTSAPIEGTVRTNSGTTTAVSTAGYTTPDATPAAFGPQTIMFVSIGNSTARFAPGASGNELIDVGLLNSKGIAVENTTHQVSAPTVNPAGTLSAATSWAAVTVTLAPDRTVLPPVANAGFDRVVKPGRQQLLDGRRSGKPQGSIPDMPAVSDPGKGDATLSYSWAQVGGPSVGAITAGPQGGRVAFYTPPAAAAGTELTFRLTVQRSDGQQPTDVDDVVHTVGPIAPRVELVLGDMAPTTVELPSSTTPTLDDPLLYLDGLSISWRYSAPEQVVRQIEPMVAKLQLSTPDVANLWGLESGLPGFVRVFDEYGDHVASVHGRLSELTATQALYKRKGLPKQLRTVVQLDVVDHLGTEGEVIEELVTPLQKMGEYFYDINPLTDLELDFPVSWFDPDPVISVVGRARAATVQNVALVDHIRALLFESPLSTTPTSSTDDAVYVGHYMLLPISVTGPGTEPGAEGYRPDGALDHLSLHIVPGIESPIGHNYFPARNLVEPDTDHPHVIPAQLVELGGTYRQQANRRPNAVSVKLRNNADTADTTTSVKATPGRKNRVTRQLDAALACLLPAGQISATYGAPIARMHLVEQDVPSGSWDRDGFVYRPESFADLTGGRNGDWYAGEHFGRINAFGPLGGCWFPDLRRWDMPDQDPMTGSGGELQYEQSTGGWDDGNQNERLWELAPECFLVPVVIDGIPAHGSLARWDGRYVGHLSAATLTIEKGKPVVQFELTQTEPEPSLPAPTIDPDTRI